MKTFLSKFKFKFLLISMNLLNFFYRYNELKQLNFEFTEGCYMNTFMSNK